MTTHANKKKEYGSDSITTTDGGRWHLRGEAAAAGRKRYPLVLMLEPLFRCNLACFGCGKIDYPGRDPEQAPVGARNASTRSTSAARRWSPFPAASR